MLSLCGKFFFISHLAQQARVTSFHQFSILIIHLYQCISISQCPCPTQAITKIQSFTPLIPNNDFSMPNNL